MKTGRPDALATENGRPRPVDARGPRWHLLYLLLAAFDVLTVCASLFFNHLLIEIHNESLRVAELLSGVSRSAGAANAPGNDVFDTREVARERRRLLAGQAEFEAALAGVSEHVSSRQADLFAIRAAMAAMGAEAELIFQAFEAGEPGRAGERMATMDRRYADVNAAIAEFGRHMRQEQIEQAESLRRFEYLVGGSVALMVMAALYYGHRLRQEVRTTEAERRRHTSELAASEEKFRSLVETTHAVPWQWDLAARRFTYVGPQAQTLLGCPSDEWLRPGFWDERVHPEERAAVRERWSKASTSGAEVELEYRMKREDGGWIWVRSIVGGGRTAEDTHLRGLMFDITERRQLEQELRQAQKLESVGRLASGVAHEINTPVQFVSDSVHFVRDAFRDLAGLMPKYEDLRAAVADGRASPALAEEVALAEAEADVSYLLDNVPKALERSIEGLNRVATIVRSMKEFAHPDQKEMAPIDLNQAILSTLTIARNEYKYVAELETDLGDLPSVTCLAGEFNQVVLNLVVNAAHAIGDVVKGTDNMGRITVRTRQEGDDVVISIGDTGGGIPVGIRERIFDPFFTTKEVGKGTGQGLAIARAVVVEKHGGSVTFETEMGNGTTFLIRLPIAGKEHGPVTAAA